MRKHFLILTIVLAFFYISFSQTAFAYDIAACVPCSSCNAAYFGKDASCTNVICSLISCINPAYNQCEATFLSAGISCGSGNTCCSGKCQTDPRTDTQCQNKVCGVLGWSATNKADETYCTDKNGKASKCLSGVCQVVTTVPACPDGTLEGACCATPGQKCKRDASNNLACAADLTCPFWVNNKNA